MYPSTRAFVDALDAAGELHRVSVPVDPVLEIAEITDRISKSAAPTASDTARRTDPARHDRGGKALLFENVVGATMPLLINAYGSYRRVQMALGCVEGGFEALADRLAALTKPQPPVGIIEKLKAIPQLAKIASFGPKLISHGPCQQVIKCGGDDGESLDLFALPAIKCWPLDGDTKAVGYAGDVASNTGGGRYITMASIFTIHPEDAGKPPGTPRPSRNVGMYRMQLLDRTHTAMHWHMHHDGARHWRAWKRLGRPMPCAAVLGGESVLPYCATAPLPPGVSELLFAGFLKQGPVELIPCVSEGVDLHVPAHAEIVIEGFVSTEAGPPGYDPRRPQDGPLGPGAFFEGPFGDHTGYYSLPDRYPIFEVTAITHRRDPIYPTTIVGLPPQEDYYLGKATERIFLPLLQTMIPDIIDYDLPMFGAFHNCAFVQIRKEYPLQARRVMHAIWGAGQMAWTKLIVVVDDDVDVHDHEQVLFHLCANVDPGRDLEIVNGPLDILDHAAPRLGAGHKIGFDATRKIPGEEAGGHPIREWPTVIHMDADTKALVDRRWREYGLG